MDETNYGAKNLQDEESRKVIAESLFKLMKSPSIDETLESERNRVSVHLIGNGEALLRRTYTCFFQEFQISMRTSSIIFKETIHHVEQTYKSWAAVLDLVKYVKFDFQKNLMRKHLNCFVLYSDTDSMIYEVKHTDFFDELAKNAVASFSDFSKYPLNNKRYNAVYKMVTLKFKGELEGTPLDEIVGLKPKMYPIMAGGKQKASAKCITKFAQRKLTHELLKTTLRTNESF